MCTQKFFFAHGVETNGLGKNTAKVTKMPLRYLILQLLKNNLHRDIPGNVVIMKDSTGVKKPMSFKCVEI